MGKGNVAPAPVMVWACAVMVMLASMAAMIYLINLESPIRKWDRTRKYLVTVILQYCYKIRWRESIAFAWSLSDIFIIGLLFCF